MSTELIMTFNLFLRKKTKNNIPRRLIKSLTSAKTFRLKSHKKFGENQLIQKIKYRGSGRRWDKLKPRPLQRVAGYEVPAQPGEL